MSASVGIGEGTSVQAPESRLTRMPTPAVFAQESGKLLRESASPPFAEVTKLLGVDYALGGLTIIRSAEPQVDTLPNLTKVRLARAAALHELLRDNTNPDESTTETAVDLIMTDPLQREQARGQARELSQLHTEEAATSIDQDFVREHGGFAMESRMLGKRITREQAVALASTFSSGEFNLSAREKNLVLNYITTSSTNKEGFFTDTSISQDEVHKIIQAVTLRTRVYTNIVTDSFPKVESHTNIPFSALSPITAPVFDEYRNSQDVTGLQKLVANVKAQPVVSETVSAPDTNTELVSLALNCLALANKAENLNTPEKLAEYRQKLLGICIKLSPENTRRFLSDPYVGESLKYFFDIQPEKIDLALQIAGDVSKLETTHTIDPQFLQALGIGAYVTLEMLREKGLTTLTASQISARLKTEEENAEDSTWGQEALRRHTQEYLSRVDQSLTGFALERQLTNVIALDIHDRLKARTAEMAWLGQSQGVEVEVLKYIKKSPMALSRGVDAKWLPRGIPKNRLARTDWQLLPLLGVHEDVGERDYQVYEMATSPTDSVAAQTTVLFELIEGGFIDESKLSDDRVDNGRKGKEGYSLHASTTFPRSIINNGSMAEYRNMARALAGAFASDQRIAFGGFMSGGEETSNKSLSGNLKEVGKGDGESHNLPKDKALIEIRNLDVTLRDQYSALVNKEILDYAFRCAWENYTQPGKSQNLVDGFASQSWRTYTQELQSLFGKYGISSEQLYKKHGGAWESIAWKEMADAKEQHPELRQELARLTRKHTGEIRAFKRSVERDGLTEAAEGAPTEIVRFLSTEPLGTHPDRLYLSQEERVKMGVKPGEVITLRFGEILHTVHVAQARVRGDGTIEGPHDATLRLSKNVLDALSLPNGYAAVPIFNGISRELNLASAESPEAPIVKIREPRKLQVETEGTFPDRFYMTRGDRKRLGVTVGQEIFVRFGTMRKAVKVAEAKKRTDGTVETPASGNWRVSKNVIEEFGLPEGISLRTRFDSATLEFSFGPSIAHLNEVDEMGDGKVKVWGGKKFFRQSAQQGSEYGVFTCIVDPNVQQPDVIRQGKVDAFIPDSKRPGRWTKIRIPIPDVSFDRDITPKSATQKELEALIPYHITSLEQQDLTKDKLQFARIFKESSQHPETIAIQNAENLENVNGLEQFLNIHPKIILKPRYGLQGKGILTVEKQPDGYKIVGSVKDSENKVTPFEQHVTTIAEVFEATREIRNGQKYIAQKKIPLARYRYYYEGKQYERTPEIRVIMQRGIDGQARITGMVTRLIDPQHTGEEYLKDPVAVLESVFPNQAQHSIDSIRALGFSALKLFEEKIGKMTGELTFDMGITTDGNPVIIEANSKAETRTMFSDKDVQNEDAAYQSTVRPNEYALFLTDMN